MPVVIISGHGNIEIAVAAIKQGAYDFIEKPFNIDQLMARAAGTVAPPVKKKLSVERSATPAGPAVDERPAAPPVSAPVTPAEAPVPAQAPPAPVSGDLATSWPDILASLADNLGRGTVSLLHSSTLKSLTDNVLTIEFPATGKMQKEMCAGKERCEQITAALSGYWGRPLRLRFELASAPAEETGPDGPKTNAQKRYELLSDPAVKAVIVGLDATVTGIERD